jgi:GNAT superfamily N-acetyltransferase
VTAGTDVGGAAGPGVVLHRVGPAGDLAADASFAVALTGLWHAVSQAGGAVGFAPPVERAEVAAMVAPEVDALRYGREHAVALVDGRTLVGFGVLRPGQRLQAHTGEIVKVMVHPDSEGRGLGGRIMIALLDRARELGLERVDLSIRDGMGLAAFYARFGFVEWGRRPGWIRVAGGGVGTGGTADRDEIFYWADLSG